jgi:hypothetical protein
MSQPSVAATPSRLVLAGAFVFAVLTANGWGSGMSIDLLLADGKADRPVDGPK